MDSYTEAHLFVAAIRILEHQKKGLPTITEVCSLLDISEEMGNQLARKYEKQQILTLHTDPFSLRLAINNHLNIEQLPKDASKEDDLAKEIERFMSKKEDMDGKVKAIQAELEEKKKKKFNDIEEQLKKQLKNIG